MARVGVANTPPARPLAGDIDDRKKELAGRASALRAAAACRLTALDARSKRDSIEARVARQQAVGVRRSSGVSMGWWRAAFSDSVRRRSSA